jgi:Xaa-Pro aminopeptidase
MRYAPIDPQLFVENRARLKQLLPPRALALLNANDVLPTNADGTMAFVQNADLFYLSGVDQEETVLVLFPDAFDEKNREILFLRETSEDIAIWEGHKLTREEARERTGIKQVRWLSEFPNLLRTLICEAEQVFLNSNEHKRAHIEVENRDGRFVRQMREQFPLHDYRRLAPLMHRLRAVKSPFEIDLIRKASALTARGFDRVLKFVRPGVKEVEVEAELAHEFIRGGGGFAYGPIIASGPNACVLHYMENDQVCKKGHLLLLDVAASYANYRSDLTRTIPVSGRFSRRQREVYNAVLRVMRGSIALAVPGKLSRDWQKESEALMEQELVGLGLLTKSQIRQQDPDRPAVKKYFMHGIGHPLGLDVHDVSDTTGPIQAGWVLTVEPGIYIKEEGLAVRLENDIVVTETSQIDLMADIPVEAKDIEKLMSPKARA